MGVDLKALRCILTLLLMLLMPKVSGAIDIGGKEVRLDLATGWYSKYMCWGLGFENFVKKGGVIQSGLTVTLWDSGFYGSLWWSYSGKGGINSDFGDELQYYIGYCKKINMVAFDFGSRYYQLYNLNETKNDLYDFELTISLPNRFVTPYCYIEMDIPVKSGGPERGWIYHFGAYSNFLKFPKFFIGQQEKQIVFTNLKLVANDGVGGLDAGITHGRLDVETEFQFGEVMFVPNLHLQVLAGDQDGDLGDIGYRDNFWYGFQFKYSF